MVMAPDQEASGGQVVKPLTDICEDNVAESPPKNGSLAEPVNGCLAKDTESGGTDKIPSMELDLCSQVNLEWFQVQRVGAGLANLGNTCFLNTVIQCLTYCPPLANYLLQNDHCSSCQSFEFCMMCELQKHIKEALQRSGDVIEPVHIYENLKLIAEHFQSGQQEDAHEFLRFVIENLRRASLYNYSNNEHIDSTIRETTVINYIFGGYNRSQVVCLRCKKRSNTYEHFMDFILDIKHNANTLEKALEHYVKPEILDKDNAYNCPQCNALVPAEKTYTIHRAPNVATIQLKRFDYNKSHGGKITKHVSYPEQLDLRPFMSEKADVPLMYKLNAVLVHVGQNCNSGHYYCYIRNSNGYWYLMDDARVQRVGLNDVLNQQAYLLFYVRMPISNGIDMKKSDVPYASDHISRRLDANGRTMSSESHSDTNLNRRRKLYMPFSKWATCRKNHWNSRRKPNIHSSHDRLVYNGSKRVDARVLSASSLDEKTCRNNRECNSISKRFGRGRNDLSFTRRVEVQSNTNGFRSYSNGFHCDSPANQSHINGGVQTSNKENKSELDRDHESNNVNLEKVYSKNLQYKDYSRPKVDWQHSTCTDQRYLNENHQNGSHNFERDYDRDNFSRSCDFERDYYNIPSHAHFHRSASDTNLYVDCNRDGRHFKESLVPGNQKGTNYSPKSCREVSESPWYKRDDWRFQECRNAYRNENGYSAERHSGTDRWGNRNGFRPNQRYSYDATNRYDYDKERPNYRKFYEKSRSAEFFTYSRPRYSPYNSTRRLSYLQECF